MPNKHGHLIQQACLEEQQYKQSAPLTLWRRRTPQVRAERDLPRPETFLSPRRVGKTSQSGHGTKTMQFSHQVLSETRASMYTEYCWPGWPSAGGSADSCSEQSGSCLFPCDGRWPSHRLSSHAASWLPVGMKVKTLRDILTQDDSGPSAKQHWWNNLYKWNLKN